ncbi:hypothetical protein C8R43DRAFT_887002 [Mycena crocata]|nr:hypothetical protein C8R43DRAFT_887002 [Mycena crocata]
MLNDFASPGKLIPTFRNPLGVLVQVRLLALIADLQAIRKVAGYMAYNATAFCNFCLLKLQDLENLDYKSWILRDAATVSQQARQWRDAVTVTAKETLAKISGVRWTPVHDVTGWNPVDYVTLGFMHNWLEGILQHHLRIFWGIGRPKKKMMTDNKNQGDIDFEDIEVTESEISESASELDDLAEEEMEHRTQGSDNDDPMEGDESGDSTTPTPETFLGLGIGMDDEDEDEDDEFFDTDITGAFNFTPEQLGAIRACIRDIDLPTWVGRPPKNLGEAKHGKLKADEYLILFTVILPLVIPELWWGENELNMGLLKNFHHLITATNIISAFSASPAKADEFTKSYVKYRADLPQLFPIPKFRSMPNHHFAMHNGALLKFWGPVAGLSEFPGERLNGMFGKVKHNRRVDDMPVTMLTQIARKGRLEALFTDEQSKEGYPGELAKILQPVIAAQIKAAQPLAELEVAKFLTTGIDLSSEDYQMLLQYQISKGQLWRSCYQMPHPLGALILPPCVVKPREFKQGRQVFSCYKSHRGNSGIRFKNPADSTLLTGFIEEIWELPLENHMQTFILVQKHKDLPTSTETPFTSLQSFEAKLVHADPSGRFCIIEPMHIITHLTVYKRPKGTYGIHNAVLAICWALNRGRRS